MRYDLLNSNLFNNIKQLLDKWVKGSYEIVDDIVNVEGNVSVEDWKEDRLPVQFGIVTGWFDCAHLQLVSLAGAPKKVGGGFTCSDNLLVSLRWAPKEIEGGFYCSHNRLLSLKGAPKKVGGSFYCQNNKLVSLEGAPKEVGGSFWCYPNPLEFL